MCNQQNLRSAAHTRSLIRAFTSQLKSVKLHIEHHLEFLSLKGCCTGSSESTLVKCRIVGNHMSWLKSILHQISRQLNCQCSLCSLTTVLKAMICPIVLMYEGCSNMNASSFITFFTYMLRQNVIPFWKELFLAFQMAPNIKKHTLFFSSYIPLYKGRSSILKLF